MTNFRLSRYIVFIVCLLMLLGFTLWWWNFHQNQRVVQDSNIEKRPQAVTFNTAAGTTRVADAWQWQTETHSTENYAGNVDDVHEIPKSAIDEDSVFRALADVKLDEDGNLIIDHEGLRGLYSAIGYGDLKLTDSQMSYLQTIIQQGLPGPSGEQVSAIVKNFYQYLEAKKQVETLYPTVASPSELNIKLADINMLREMYLGTDVANALFAEQQGHERYMMANMALSLDTSLSDDEKIIQRAGLAKQYLNQGPDISDWQIRHAAFMQDKAAILDSSLTPEEKESQIHQLYQTQFSASERNKITGLKLTEF